ncbi:MAG TPA: TonB family protein [Pyrinomonadaceae bacterium]|nr:TonB family protein [Pyrinomonadaceae bacterium]
MALTGQLSDMSLAELIEFFCNQRKTGRLKIDYPRGHSVFFIREGELVDAKVGALSGVEAVYFSLTLPNAAFDFSPDVHSTRRTISEPWTQVVLEGLRRLDEGRSPTEADAFSSWTPNESDVVVMIDQVERLGAHEAQKEFAERAAEKPTADAPADDEAAPLSMMVEGANGGGRKKWMAMGVAASVVLVCAVAAIPLSGAFGSKARPEPAPAAPAAQPAEAVGAAAPAPAEPAAEAAPEAAPAEAADASAEAADAARREREERERRERRERERRAEEREREEGGAEEVIPKPAATPSAGPKSVRVSVSYDEQGRVTQASVAGASPGAEAYGSTAVRIARGRRFPAGKAGSTVVTIPVN